jgi:hypothetical protein
VTAAPELKKWAQTKLLPVCDEWYPRIVDMLPSDGFAAPRQFTIRFRRGMTVPAMAAGSAISCSIAWFERNLEGEALGAVVHEMAHVVQQYGAARRINRDSMRNPGWLVEGVADYIRWFKYEPQTRGADVRNPEAAKYDGSYRVTANYLNFIVQKYDPQIVAKLNAAMREGQYSEDLWKQYTGKTAAELAVEWKRSLTGEVNG